MTYPRSQLVADGEPGFYHVVSRCVRRAFLCGRDKLTGQCFEHRRQWIEARILVLAECFTVSVYSYAVMHNHYHIVLHVDPTTAWALSDEEVARRWLTAFPGSLKYDNSPEAVEHRTLVITDNPERLAELRKRLGSLSWFMKALNEPIARRANREDNCTHSRSFRTRSFRLRENRTCFTPCAGKFWESRFKCQALLEEHAVLSCMAYVDLNPARADICDTLAESDHTTIQRRLRERERMTKKRNRPGRNLLDRPLTPVAGLDSDALLDMTESSYIALVQWTGEQTRSDKRGKLKPLTRHGTAAPAEIWQVASHPKQWLRQVQGTESLYYRAIGSAEALMAKAEAMGQVWMKGVASEVARKILRERPA